MRRLREEKAMAYLMQGDLRGDWPRARAYADSAAAACEQGLQDAPDDPQLHALYGVTLAYAGRKAKAIREGERAVALPASLDEAGSAPSRYHQCMSLSAAVPFVIRRVHGVVSGREVMSTKEDSHGLLHIEAAQLVAQWSTAREISRAGKEIRVDRDLGPVREVAVPLSGLAGARVRWRMFPWPPRWQLVLRAADLHAFQALAGEAGLLLEHPAELALDLRRVDRAVARVFAAELDLALAEAALLAAEGQPSLPAGSPEATPQLPRPSE